jgi:hypothetical protein
MVWLERSEDVTVSRVDARRHRPSASRIVIRYASGEEPIAIVRCGHTVLCVPTITVNVDEALKERMERHPEINWSEVTRQAIRGKIEKLELLDELTAESELTSADVAEIASRIDEGAHDHLGEARE